MDVPHFPKMNIFCIDLPANNFVIVVSYRIRGYHHAPSLPICLYQFAQPIQVVLVAQDVLDGGEAINNSGGLKLSTTIAPGQGIVSYPLCSVGMVTDVLCQTFRCQSSFCEIYAQ